MPDIREKLLKYYDEHYSANLMSLCLVGNHSIDTLEQLAVDNFSEITNKDLVLKDFTAGPALYDETAYSHIIKIIPIKDTRTITIAWPQLPSTEALWEGDPLQYISHVLGHEGQNSLLSELIKQDLASALSCGPQTRC